MIKTIPKEEAKYELDIENIPYSNRQFCVFATDEDYESAFNDSGNNKSSNTVDILTTIAAMAIPGGILTKLVTVAATEIAKEAYKRYKEVKDNISLQTLPVSVSKHLIMPMGHPLLNVLYVGHPSIANKYIPISDFHKVMFESRVAELFTILMHLGAKEIVIEVEDKHSRHFQEKVGVKVNAIEGLPNGEVGASLGNSSNKTRQVHYKGNFIGGEMQALPDDLVWYHQEPTWQMMVLGREKFGAQNFEVELNYNEDYGVNHDLSVNLSKIGFNLGGKFKDVKSNKWIMKGTF